MSKHVALLAGGLSSERDVSLKTAKEVKKSLEELGHQVTTIDVDRNVSEKLKQVNPDIAFNALHGTYGEDGCIQGILEFLQIPYTHSGILASAVGFNKQESKYIFEDIGILCPQGKTVSIEESLSKESFPKPYILKPVADGSSFGVHIIKDDSDIPSPGIFNTDKLIVEKYIPGRELTVAIMDNKALGVLEIKSKGGDFFDYNNKYKDGIAEHILPAQIDKRIYDKAMETALKAHKALGCKGITRSDFRYDEHGDGQLYMLEINTHPGLTPISLLPKIAAYKNISYNDIIKYLVDTASCEK